MINLSLKSQACNLIQHPFPLPGRENYELRLIRFFEYGRHDLSLAKIMEAHWDAVAILAEKGKSPAKNALYAVWASEIPGQPLRIDRQNDLFYLSGKKMFCSGSYLADRALITADENLIDVDLQNYSRKYIHCDKNLWSTNAFSKTNTYSLCFDRLPFTKEDILGPKNWYASRPGFWHGSLGPAACWAGGAAGLVDYAKKTSRQDPHTLAHLAAMEANTFSMTALLSQAGIQIDSQGHDLYFSECLALKIRHSIEQLCSDVLRRFARAYGPYPLSCEESVSLRYQELDLFLRQNHAERDLERLGRLIKNPLGI